MQRNKLNIIECWTDASYSPQHKLSVFGYKIGQNKIKTFVSELKNTQAELEAISKCIEECKKLYPDINNPNLNFVIIIYSDCQRAIMNEYDSFVKIIKIKGHSKKSEKNNVDMIFSYVDKEVRKVLRNKIKEVMFDNDKNNKNLN